MKHELSKEELLELSGKISRGTATDNEIASYNAWFNAQMTADGWNKQDLGDETEKKSYIFSNIEREINARKPARVQSLITKITAAASILIGLSLGFYYYSNRDKTADNEKHQADISFLQVTNNSNQSKLVRMADGSLAVLRTGSTIRYPHLFNGETRDIYLEGEAFFEVHKNPKKPFLVHSQDMITKVLGTSFTVRSFKNDAEFKVVVNTGHVLVYHKKVSETSPKANVVSLLPNEQVVFKRQRDVFKKDTLNTPLVLSKEIAKKEFTFYDVPLSRIIKKLDKAYNVDIIYDEAGLGNLTLTASLSDRPLDEKVKFICKAINAKCSFINGSIVIDSKTESNNQ